MKGMKRGAIIRKTVTTTVRVARAQKISNLYRKINKIFVCLCSNLKLSVRQRFIFNFFMNEILNHDVISNTYIAKFNTQTRICIYLSYVITCNDVVLSLIAKVEEKS